MSRNIRSMYGLLLVVMAAALALAGIGPAQAQQQGTLTPGAGLSLQSGDTLGSVLGQFRLTDLQVEELLLENAHLVVDAGQTVTFPVGVPVTGAEAGPAGAGTGTAQPAVTAGAVGGVGTPAAAGGTPQVPTAGSSMAGTAEATVPAAGGMSTAQATVPAGSMGTAEATTSSAGVQGTGTPVPVTGGQAGTQTGFVCEVGDADPGETYVTLEGDTLGTLLTAMGVDVPVRDSGVQMETGTPAATSMGGVSTGTPVTGGIGGQATGTPAGSGGQVAGTPAAGGAGQVTTDQMVDFVNLNCDLEFDDDTVQSLVVPAGIPLTGGVPQVQGTQVGTQQATGAAQVTATQQPTAAVQATATSQPTVAAQATATRQPTAAAQATATTGAQPTAQATAIPPTGPQPQAGQSGPFQLCHSYADPENLGRHTAIYVARSGDSVETIARQFGMTLEDLLNLNPGIGDGRMIFNQQWILVNPGERVVTNPPGWEERCNVNP